MSNPIPKGQNAFTYKPESVFTPAERRYMKLSARGRAQGSTTAKRSKGIAVLGLKGNPDNAPPEYKR